MKNKLFIVSLIGYKKYKFVKKLSKYFDLVDARIFEKNSNFKSLIKQIKKEKFFFYVLYLLPQINRSYTNNLYIQNIKKVALLKKLVIKKKNCLSIDIANTQIRNLDIFFPKIFSLFYRFYVSIFSMIAKYYYKEYPSNITVLTGLKTKTNLPFSKSKFLFWHNYDYEIFKNYNVSKPKKNNVAIYLDQNFDHNHDTYFTGNKKKNLKDFYTKLDQFFFYFQKEFRLKIIIASHPRRNSFDSPIFRNFKNIQGNTHKLILNSSLVLAHCSLAVSFATLYKKNIIFLTSEELNRTIYQKRINMFVKFFECNTLDISLRNFHLNNYYGNKLKYKNYINNYLRHPQSKNESFNSLISRIIK